MSFEYIVTTYNYDFGQPEATPYMQREILRSHYKRIIDQSFNENNNSRFDNVGTFSANCCKHCPNNPMNNPAATGFCNCVLPSMEQIYY